MDNYLERISSALERIATALEGRQTSLPLATEPETKTETKKAPKAVKAEEPKQEPKAVKAEEPKAEPKQEPKAEPKAETGPKAPTIDELREIATPLIKSGKQAEVMALIRSYGVTKVPEIPAAKLPEYAEKLKALAASK